MPKPKPTRRPSAEPAPKSESNAVLWRNVLALMEHKYGKENLTALARDSKIGPGTATRIKEQQTSVGIDVLEKVAACFNLAPWQLLVPGLQPKTPPVIRMATKSELDLYSTLERTKVALDSFLEQTRPGDL